MVANEELWSKKVVLISLQTYPAFPMGIGTALFVPYLEAYVRSTYKNKSCYNCATP